MICCNIAIGSLLEPISGTTYPELGFSSNVILRLGSIGAAGILLEISKPPSRRLVGGGLLA